MAATSPRKTRRSPVYHCYSCGARLPSPWQGRKTITAVVVVLLLLASAAGGWRLAQHQFQVERQQLTRDRQGLEESRPQRVTERQLAAAGGEASKPAEEQPALPAKPVEEQPPTPGPTGQTWTSPMGMQFVLIPKGAFQMGSRDPDARDDEKPVHPVTISKPFYLGQYEVTQGQWQAVMETNPSKFKGDAQLPVENVS